MDHFSSFCRQSLYAVGFSVAAATLLQTNLPGMATLRADLPYLTEMPDTQNLAQQLYPTSVTTVAEIDPMSVTAPEPSVIAPVSTVTVTPTVPTPTVIVTPTIPINSVAISPTIPINSVAISPTIPTQSVGISPTIPINSVAISPTIPTQSVGISPTIPINSVAISPTIPTGTPTMPGTSTPVSTTSNTRIALPTSAIAPIFKAFQMKITDGSSPVVVPAKQTSKDLMHAAAEEKQEDPWITPYIAADQPAHIAEDSIWNSISTAISSVFGVFTSVVRIPLK
ncbi:hypothetical protein HZA45_03085 [Candidatus Peregrinibacteria bacterium]|nr:hypothetical protein [Candidatus Peregrinibacteria bacterium]